MSAPALAPMRSSPSSPHPPLGDVRALTPWYAIELLNSFACTLLLVCVPYFLKARHGEGPGTVYSLWQSAGWGLMYIPFALLAGRLSDRWGPRTLLVRATLAAIPAILLGLLAVRYPNLWLLFACLTVFNLTNTIGWPALESAMTRSPGRSALSTRTGIYNVVWSSAGFLAFPTADLVRALGWSSMFLLPAIVCVAAAVVAVALTIPESLLSSAHTPAAEEPADRPAPNARALLLMAWVGNPMGYVAINTLMALMPRVSPDYVSLASVWKLTTVVGFLVWWKWSGWHYRLGLMLLAYAGLAASFFAMIFFAQPAHGTPVGILVPAQIVFGLAASFIYASSLYYAMHVSSGGGSHAGMHEALIGFGIFLGCAVGALASGSTTLAPVAWSVTGILAGGGLIMAILALRSRTLAAAAPASHGSHA